MTVDYYKLLGISRNANGDQIKKAFKSMALKHHPDKTGNGSNESDTFKIINEAYQILSDPKKKEMYDITLTVSEGVEDDNKTNGDTGGNEMLSKLITMMFDFLKTKVQEKFKKNQPEQTLKKKISLNINIEMEDIYYGLTRKINVKVKREGGFESVSIYLCFIDFKPEYIFEGMGDDMGDGGRGDIHVKVNVTNDKGFIVDQLLDSSDIIYQPEIEISLYELYYGKHVNLEYFGGEQLSELVEFEVNKPLVHVIKDKGALYTSTEDEVKRGNVYLYFKLKLPELEQKMDKDSGIEIENILKQYFK